MARMLGGRWASGAANCGWQRWQALQHLSAQACMLTRGSARLSAPPPDRHGPAQPGGHDCPDVGGHDRHDRRLFQAAAHRRQVPELRGAQPDHQAVRWLRVAALLAAAADPGLAAPQLERKLATRRCACSPTAARRERPGCTSAATCPSDPQTHTPLPTLTSGLGLPPTAACREGHAKLFMMPLSAKKRAQNQVQGTPILSALQRLSQDAKVGFGAGVVGWGGGARLRTRPRGSGH